MKKLIIMAGLLLVMAHAAFAEQWGVFMEIHKKSIPEKNMSVNRSPMRLPIEVVYDSDTHKIKVMEDVAIIDSVISLKDAPLIYVMFMGH